MQKKTMGLLALAGFVLAALGTAALADRSGPEWMHAGGMRGEMMRGEMMRGGGPMADVDFAAVDADGDGRMTEAELTAWRAGRVAALDTNGDGLLSAEEIAAGRLADMRARADEMAARMIAAQDADGDGLLSAAELAAPPLPPRLFGRIDADGDGAITEAELDAARAHMAGRWGRHGPGAGRDE